MQIEWRQRIAARHDLHRTGERGHEFAQRLLHLQDHMRAALGDQRGVTAELDRVAEALLGMEENGPALDLLGSKPQWLREIALGVLKLRRCPSPFVFLPAAIEVPQQQPADRFVVMRIGKIRPQRQRALITFQCRVVALEIMQGSAAIGDSLGIIRPQRQRALVARQRLLEPLQEMQGIAAIIMCLGIIRPQRQRAVVARQRLVEPPQLVQGVAAIIVDLGHRRPQRQRAVVADQRLLVALQAAQDIAANGVQLRQYPDARPARGRNLPALRRTA